MKEYTIQQFHTLLKLGIFKSGKVADWGYVSSGSINHSLLRKPVAEYETRPLVKKQLGIGLHLLDFYLLGKNDHRSTHIMVVSAHRVAIEQEAKVYVLKLVTTHKNEAIKTAVKENESLEKAQKYVYKIKPRKEAIGGISRKHYINRGSVT